MIFATSLFERSAAEERISDSCSRREARSVDTGVDLHRVKSGTRKQGKWCLRTCDSPVRLSERRSEFEAPRCH